MDALVHPTQLSVWQRFLQARRLHRETSRSKNPDWYRSALLLDCQLHLFVEGDEIADAHICDRRGPEAKWSKVTPPPLKLEDDDAEETLKEYITNLRAKQFSGKPRSLGVVLFLADEFAISELTRVTEPPEDLGELGRRLVGNPQELLEDHSVSGDDFSYRLVPYPGAAPGQLFGAAITIARKHQGYLRLFRRVGEAMNVPVQTAALSAPLVALGALPRLTPEIPAQPFCVFFSYSTFSVLAFFRHEGELVMLRSVRHHAGGTPPNVGRIIQTMAAALELPDPLVFVLSLSQGRQGEIVAGLPDLPNASILEWRQSNEFDAGIPLEFQSTQPGKSTATDPTGLVATKTFRQFTERQWLLQDFLLPGPEEEELYPGPVEMKALRYGATAFKIGAAALLLYAAWGGVRAFQILRDPAWHSGSQAVSNRGNQVLQTKIDSYQKWDSFLADRSKAWVTMELLNRVFPNPKAVLLSEVNHTVRPDATKAEQNASLIKEWRITGYVNDEALDHLTIINTREGINKVFAEACRHTGDESLRPDLPSRNLVVNLLASENKGYDPQNGELMSSQFPFIFNLTITQRLSSEDPLAVPVLAAR